MKIKRDSNSKNSSNENASILRATQPKSREKYLLERDRIKNEIGGLDQIRETLGLSQRRACQLLLVDPSAWTRWNKTEAPPHIYQALRWLLELKKVNPEAAGPSDIHRRIDSVQAITQTKIKELEYNLTVIERSLALSSQAAPAIVTSEYSIEGALAEQEARFLERIHGLENRIQEFLSKKAGSKVSSRRKLRKRTKNSKVKKAKLRIKSLATKNSKRKKTGLKMRRTKVRKGR